MEQHGDSVTVRESLESECNTKCTGDQTQTCGGLWKWNVFTVESPEIFSGQCMTAYHVSIGGPVWIRHGKFVNDLTLEMCLEHCKNFKYAALGNGENCFCVDNLPKINLLADSACDKPCVGDLSNKKCGGSSKWSVYRINTQPLTGQCIQDQSCEFGISQV